MTPASANAAAATSSSTPTIGATELVEVKSVAAEALLFLAGMALAADGGAAP